MEINNNLDKCERLALGSDEDFLIAKELLSDRDTDKKKFCQMLNSKQVNWNFKFNKKDKDISRVRPNMPTLPFKF